VTARGAGEAACGAGDRAACGAGEEVIGEGRGNASGRQELVRRSNRSEHSVRCIQKLEGHRCVGVIPLSERKDSLIKDDASGDDYLVGRHVKAAVSFVVSRVTKKDIQGRSRSEFVGGCGRQVRIAFATEDSEVCVSRRCAKEGKMRRGEAKSLGRQNVNQRSGCGESLDPVGRRHGGLK
jgi:hypothetical protein